MAPIFDNYDPIPCAFPPAVLTRETVALAAITLVLFSLCPANHEHSAHAPHEAIVIKFEAPHEPSTGDLSIEIPPETVTITGYAPTVLIQAAA